MKHFILAVLMLGLATPAMAARHPYDQRVVELTDILEDDHLREELAKAGSIDSIVRNGDIVHITAGSCAITVGLDYEVPVPGLVGPRSYDIYVDEVRCLERESDR